MELFEKIRDIIANSIGCEADAIAQETDIKEDLGADSLAVVELIMAIEDEFGITIEEEEVTAVVTVADVINLVAGKAA